MQVQLLKGRDMIVISFSLSDGTAQAFDEWLLIHLMNDSFSLQGVEGSYSQVSSRLF